MNEVYGDIAELFTSAGVPDFEKLPQDRSVCAKFAKLFRELNDYMEAARVQGFTWNQSVYHCPDDAADETIDVEMLFDESAYLIWHSAIRNCPPSRRTLPMTAMRRMIGGLFDGNRHRCD